MKCSPGRKAARSLHQRVHAKGNSRGRFNILGKPVEGAFGLSIGQRRGKKNVTA